MKAAIYHQPGAPEVFRYEEVADPHVGDHDLLIRVEAISVEGGDLASRRDTQPEKNEVPGYAAAGEILKLGKRVEDFSIGQKVTTFAWKGAYGELRAVPASQSFLVPDGLDLNIAAAIPVGAGTAAWALQLAGLKPGQTVLILGAAGGVGMVAVQLAALAGARVIGTGTHQASLDKLKPYGLDIGVVASETPTSQQVLKLLDGEKVDVVIDNIGGDALIDALNALVDGGIAILVGVFGSRNTQIDAGHLLVHRQTLVGCLFGNEMSEPEAHTVVDKVLKMARDGQLKIPIDATFELSEAGAAHRRAEQRGRLGRVIITPSADQTDAPSQ